MSSRRVVRVFHADGTYLTLPVDDDTSVRDLRHALQRKESLATGHAEELRVLYLLTRSSPADEERVRDDAVVGTLVEGDGSGDRVLVYRLPSESSERVWQPRSAPGSGRSEDGASPPSSQRIGSMRRLAKSFGRGSARSLRSDSPSREATPTPPPAESNDPTLGPEARAELHARLQQQVARHDILSAQETADLLVAAQPDDVDLRVTRARLHTRLCRLDLANGDLAAVLKLDPEWCKRDVAMQGFLLQQGTKVRGWRSRLFCLKGPFLFYFRSYADKAPTGTIFLHPRTTIRAITFETGSGRGSLRGRSTSATAVGSFEVDTLARKYVVAATSMAERQEWIDALLEATRVPAIKEPTTSSGRIRPVSEEILQHNLAIVRERINSTGSELSSASSPTPPPEPVLEPLDPLELQALVEKPSKGPQKVTAGKIRASPWSSSRRSSPLTKMQRPLLAGDDFAEDARDEEDRRCCSCLIS